MKTLVLGLGNDLYGDDGVGCQVVLQLIEERNAGKAPWAAMERVDMEACGLTGLKLLDVIAGYERVIIIDTIKKDRPETGRITLLKGSELRHIPGPSVHYVSIPQALSIGREAGLAVPSQIDVIAVEAKNLYQMGEGLTEEMTEAIPEIIAALKKLLQNHDKERNPS
jgi:hydrogenase maturation protease